MSEDKFKNSEEQDLKADKKYINEKEIDKTSMDHISNNEGKTIEGQDDVVENNKSISDNKVADSVNSLNNSNNSKTNKNTASKKKNKRRMYLVLLLLLLDMLFLEENI